MVVFFVVVFLWWCGGVCVVVFLRWCGDVLGVMWWCLRGGVFCGGGSFGWW